MHDKKCQKVFVECKSDLIAYKEAEYGTTSMHETKSRLQMTVDGIVHSNSSSKVWIEKNKNGMLLVVMLCIIKWIILPAI